MRSPHPPLLLASLTGGRVVLTGGGARSVGPPWQADEPRVAVLHAYSHLATNFRNLQARFDRDTLAALPLEKLAYFRPPFTSEAHSLRGFLEKPDMTWGCTRTRPPSLSRKPRCSLPVPPLLADEGVGDTSGRKGDPSDGGTAAQLLSIEAMQRRGFLGEAEAEAAKQKVLGLPKL